MKTLYELPLSSFEIDYVYLDDDVIRFQYSRDGVRYRSGLSFNGTAATMTRAERCATLWHMEAFDKLVEVEDSAWRAEIRAETDKEDRDYWEMHHYLIYFDSVGSFEFIADSWHLLPETEGEWVET